jgi:hypothetical protein
MRVTDIASLTHMKTALRELMTIGDMKTRTIIKTLH